MAAPARDRFPRPPAGRRATTCKAEISHGAAASRASAMLLLLLMAAASGQFLPAAPSDFRRCLLRASDDADVSADCRRHLRLYADALDDAEDWAVRMWDSSTKALEGVLVGAATHLGNFDECVGVAMSAFRGQHCLVDAAFRDSEVFRKPVTGAVCLPASCSPEDTAVAARRHLLLLATTDVSVDPLRCHTALPKPFSAADWAATGVLASFLLLVALSSLYDVVVTSAGRTPSLPLSSFSAPRNWRRLTSTSRPAGSLDALHGVRVLSMFFIVVGHRVANTMKAPSSNVDLAMATTLSHWSSLWLSNGTLYVDSFFVLSGTLASYVLLRRPRDSFGLWQFYVHRYVRVTPAFAATMLMHATLLLHARSSPLWDSASSGGCDSLWWANLLYVKNYYRPLQECVGHSWYLQVDMQLHWLSPLVLLPLWRKPRLGRWIVATLLLLGVLVNVASTLLLDVIVSVPQRQAPNDDEDVHRVYMYFPTHARFNPWLVGVFTGHLLHNLRKDSPLSRRSVGAALWTGAAVLMLGSLAAIQPFVERGQQLGRLYAALFHGLCRTLWAVGVALVVVACCAGHGGLVNRFLSWKGFLPLSRLTFCVYLTHPALQTLTGNATKTLVYVDELQMVTQGLADMATSVVVATVWTMAFEAPFLALEKCLVGKQTL